MGDAAADPRLAGTTIAPSVVDLIGNTPLVRLRRISEVEQIPSVLAMKMETTNPGGSSKDRPALEMVLAAERDGLIGPGGTIVEPTSGNTGVGLAIVAAQRGYRCVFVMTDKVAPEKISLLQAYGAEVVVCPVAVAPEDPQSYYSVAERLTKELQAFRPNQYANPANPLAHEKTTGPELWTQTAGRITHFVAGAGTCGSITGVARYLKARNPAIQIIAADPEGSVFSGGSGRPYLVEGVGEDFFPAAWDRDLYDDVIPISDEESFLTARRVSEVEGILIGGSGGMAVAAAIRVAKRAAPDDIVVVFNPDSGRGYLSRVFDDEWMANYGFLRECDECVGAVLDSAPRAQRAAVRQPRPDGPPGHRADARQRRQPAPGVQEHAAVRGRRGVRFGRRAGADGGDRPRPVGDEHARREGHERQAADDRRRPEGRARREDAGGRPRPARPLRRATARRRARAPTSSATSRPSPSTWKGAPAMGEASDEQQPGGWGFDTRAVHAGQQPDPATGAVVTPISLSTTFAQEGVGGHKGFEYSRSGNPTRAALEACVASLESARHGLAFASGLAAEDNVLRLVPPRGRVVLGNDAYGGTFRLIARVWGPLGMQWTAADLTDVDALARDWAPDTAMVWLETPTNPLLTCIDIEAVASVAHDHGALVVVDNTFATPYLQQPLTLGADIVVHSATKYLGGHSDVVGGFVAVDDDGLADRLRFTQNAAGAVPAPFDCYLVLRGVKTLAVRMERHCLNARAVVDLLVGHPAVERVLYPQLPDHPGHAAAARQMRDFGGMVSCTLRGGAEAAKRVAASTELFVLAESLGAVESLIEHPGEMTHASVAGSPLEVPANLLRLSVGIESSADLVADLAQALDQLP